MRVSGFLVSSAFFLLLTGNASAATLYADPISSSSGGFNGVASGTNINGIDGWSTSDDLVFHTGSEGHFRASPNGLSVGTRAVSAPADPADINLTASIDGRYRNGGFETSFSFLDGGTEILKFGSGTTDEYVLGPSVTYVPVSNPISDSGHLFFNLRLEYTEIGGVGTGSLFATPLVPDTSTPDGMESLVGTFSATADIQSIDGIQVTSRSGADRTMTIDVQTSAIPEPTTFALIGIALVGTASVRRRM